MKSDFKKKLIVNGKLNPSLSLSEIIGYFIRKDWVEAAWHIKIELGDYLNETIHYDSIKMCPKYYLTKFWHLRDEALKKRITARNKKYVMEGMHIHGVLRGITSPRGYNLSHTLSFYPYQAIGYLQCSYSWNDFNNNTMIEVIKNIEKLNLRSDYGFNNPNTNQEIITWKTIVDDRWILCISCPGQTRENILKQRNKIYSILKMAKPSNIEIIRNDSLYIEISMWWD